jgi:hypothetical protein
MSVLENVGEFHHSANLQLAYNQPPDLQPLLDHLVSKVGTKTEALERAGKHLEVYGPDWCRANPELAGQMHADLILATYGDTYALPNKDPKANEKAILNGELDVYFMLVDGEPTTTACMVNTLDGRAELGRAASRATVPGESGDSGSIILDLRIIDWLTNPATANNYHTLFTTLRTAPDRQLEDDFVMRGGQAISSHWSKFPCVRVSGFGPLYYKHGALEQFAVASISRNEVDSTLPLFVHDPAHIDFVRAWHDHYDLHPPLINAVEDELGPHAPNFIPHYPPQESGLTELVHADVVPTNNGIGVPLGSAIHETSLVQSPFTQVVVPLNRDTRALQDSLTRAGFQVFGYQHADSMTAPALLFGRTRPDCSVVPTFWSDQGGSNPFWKSPYLHATAETIVQRWQ